MFIYSFVHLFFYLFLRATRTRPGVTCAHNGVSRSASLFRLVDHPWITHSPFFPLTALLLASLLKKSSLILFAYIRLRRRSFYKMVFTSREFFRAKKKKSNKWNEKKEQTWCEKTTLKKKRVNVAGPLQTLILMRPHLMLSIFALLRWMASPQLPPTQKREHKSIPKWMQKKKKFPLTRQTKHSYFIAADGKFQRNIKKIKINEKNSLNVLYAYFPH